MRNHRQPLKLLPPGALLKTGEVDHADWNYRPLLGSISRTRFKLARRLLATQPRAARLLEVGYGSGVFMPELARLCDALYGIDVHASHQSVEAMLKQFDVAARLFSGSVAKMPFEDGLFDAVVAVSALEFVADLDAAAVEIARVMRPSGIFVVITPGHSPLVDFGLKALTGKSAKRDFDDRRESLIPALLKRFAVERRLTTPALGSSIVNLYTALLLRAR